MWQRDADIVLWKALSMGTSGEGEKEDSGKTAVTHKTLKPHSFLCSVPHLSMCDVYAHTHTQSLSPRMQTRWGTLPSHSSFSTSNHAQPQPEPPLTDSPDPIASRKVATLI